MLRTAHARLLAATRRTPRNDGPSPLMRSVAGGMRILGIVVATGLAVWAAWHIALLLIRVPFPTWMRIGVAGALTLSRVLAAVAIGTLWAVPAGLAIGLSPALSRRLQPVVQVLAAFPAPMLYPAVVWLLSALGIGIGTGSIVLMLLGAQWYILFNVSAGAMSVPSDLRACADSFRITGVRRWKRLYLPAIFPSLITGWVTAAGGAWNASIVSEYVHAHGSWLVANGLGSMVSTAAADGDFPALAASVVAMSAIVVLFNRLVWKRLYAFSRERFSLGSF
jgi:NitT/TauT family transport system permease protein